jgi:phosphatidylglycerophosphate synthase
MNLHRTEGGADYDKVNPEDRNKHQVVASASRGLLTLANLVSVTGLAVTESGIRDIERKEYRRGCAKVVVGRCFDLLDGYIADKTGTKSPTGEFVDATVDKFLIGRGVKVLRRSEIIPESVAWSFGVQNVCNAVSSGVAKARGIELHASGMGKATTFAQWGTLLGYSAQAGLSQASSEGLHDMQSIETTADISALATSVMGAVVSIDYLRTAFGPTSVDAEAA